VTKVFLDTVGLIALWEGDDQWHQGALDAMARLNKPGITLVTSSLILVECGNAASRRPFRADVAQLREKMLSDNRVIIPTEIDLDRAWRDYAAGHAGDASIVDHVSFTLMRRLGITDALTNDRHFKAAGFRTLF
jgi:predicted nucleic acid-binding protein